MPRANLTTAVILAAAADIADDAGYDVITISTIARRFGVQPASLYSHVRDVAAVKDGLHELALGELADRVAVAIAGRATTDALRGFADAHRRYAADRPGCWTSVQRPASESTVNSDAAARLSAQLLAVVSGYDLPTSEHVHAARFVGATVNGYLTLNRVGAFDHRTPNPDAYWTRTISAIDTALSAWPTEETENP